MRQRKEALTMLRLPSVFFEWGPHLCINGISNLRDEISTKINITKDLHIKIKKIKQLASGPLLLVGFQELVHCGRGTLELCAGSSFKFSKIDNAIKNEWWTRGIFPSSTIYFQDSKLRWSAW